MILNVSDQLISTGGLILTVPDSVIGRFHIPFGQTITAINPSK